MVTITVTLSEDHLQKLQDLAEQFRIAPEELLRVSVEELHRASAGRLSKSH